MRRFLASLAAGTVFLAACAPAAAAGPPVRPKGEDGPLGNERLSDERLLTRWAHTNLAGPIRARPADGARRVGKLRFNTEDGPPEVYLVLRSRLDADGDAWLEVRIPGRPNGRTGWVPEQSLSALYVVETFLRIDRRAARATLFDRGRRVWTSRIGHGKRGTPTPPGRFYVRTRLRNLRGSPVYGPWAFGTSAYSRLSDWPGGGVVGIHGTNQPGLIPGRPSHGCVRVPNAKVKRLARLLPIGTPIAIAN